MRMPSDLARNRSLASLLVGRETELVVLRECYARALAGQGRLVLVSGEAGIGKTALVQAFTDERGQDEALILRGYCYDLSTTPPYGLWLELTDRYRASGDLPELPEVLKRGTGVGELASQAELFNVVRAFLVELSLKRPLLLVLEDLHWADQASLDLVRYLARQLDDDRILMVATYRDDEVTRKHPLFALLPSLIRESQATRIELGSLTPEDVAALVRARWQLSKAHEKRLVDYLLAHTEGQPFFAVEVLRTLEQDGFIRLAHGNWSLSNLRQVPVPALVRQVIETRVAQLGEEARHFLEVAAVIGHQVPVDVWQEVAGMTDEDVLSVLDQAIALHLLEESIDDNSARFVHALTREALYSDILRPRRRIWHRLIAEALANSPNPIADAVAHHFQQADDPRAVEWLMRAGEWADDTFAWRSAVDRFLTVCRLLENDEARTRESGWIRYRAARRRLYIDPEEGVKDLDEAIGIATTTGDRVLHAASLVRRGHLRCFTGDVVRGIDEMAEGVAAWDLLSEDEKRSCEYWDIVGSDLHLNIFRGTLLLWIAQLGRYQECLEQADQFLAEMESAKERLIAGRHIYWLDGYVGIGSLYAAMGRPEQAREILELAREGFRAIGIPAMESLSSMSILRDVMIRYQTDRVAERHRVADEAVAAWIRAAGGMRTEMSSRLQRVQLMGIEGAWSELRDLAIQGMNWHANVARRIELMAALGPVARYQGDADLAWDQVKTALPEGPGTEPGINYFLESIGLVALAVELSLDSQNLDDARSWLEMYDRWLEWSGSVRGQADAKLLWAKCRLAQGNREEARRFAERSLELASAPRQPLALIAAQRFLGELDTLEQRFDSAEYRLRESLRLAESCEIPFEIALSKVALAEFHAALGQNSEAVQLLVEATAICTPLGARPTLERAERIRRSLHPKRDELPFGLTSRESDVLRLLVQGISDREIGDKLFISHHTVMRHVSSILRKLDVDSRTAAATIAVREELV